eukprot:GFYU01001141.1.p1 GENE.GFYU01001141.1~~GFYU01001141.1.p1  ORF type:complete len:221 (+),score=48.23 GFYU01001141.1:144-806(+)
MKSQNEDLKKLIKFLCSTWGTDKFLRLISYASVFSGSLMKGGNEARATQLMTFGRTIGDCRVAVRLPGAIYSIEALLHMNENDKLLRKLKIIQCWSMVLFHPLEQAWWFDLKGIYKVKNGSLYSRASCGMWLLYIVCDVIADLHRLRKLKYKLKKETDKNERREMRQQQAAIYIKLITNACDLALAVDFTRAKSKLSTTVCGGLGLTASLTGGYLMWKNT